MRPPRSKPGPAQPGPVALIASIGLGATGVPLSARGAVVLLADGVPLHDNGMTLRRSGLAGTALRSHRRRLCPDGDPRGDRCSARCATRAGRLAPGEICSPPSCCAPAARSFPRPMPAGPRASASTYPRWSGASRATAECRRDGAGCPRTHCSSSAPPATNPPRPGRAMPRTGAAPTVTALPLTRREPRAPTATIHTGARMPSSSGHRSRCRTAPPPRSTLQSPRVRVPTAWSEPGCRAKRPAPESAKSATSARSTTAGPARGLPTSAAGAPGATSTAEASPDLDTRHAGLEPDVDFILGGRRGLLCRSAGRACGGRSRGAAAEFARAERAHPPEKSNGGQAPVSDFST